MKISFVILCIFGKKNINYAEILIQILRKKTVSVLTNALPHGEQEKINCVDQEDCTELGIGAFCCQST